MESVGRLAGGVAHDFNNMLGVILGHAELALERVGPGAAAPCRPARKSATAASALRRPDPPTAGLCPQADRRAQGAGPERDAWPACSTMLQRLIGENIDLQWQPGENLWPVKVDPSQIDQILANLCVNARDAIAGVGRSPSKRGTLTFDEAYCAAHPGSVPGRVRAARRERRRLRHGQGHAVASVRAVLHDQGGGQGHRPRAGHGLRHRQAEQRLHQRLQRAGSRERRSRSTCPGMWARPGRRGRPRRRHRQASGATRPSCWWRTSRPS